VPSLLPSNSTDFERALESTVSRSVPNRLAALWNPDTCPVELLDYLAWGVAIERWDNQWPVAQKRAVIKQSIFVHQHKGTASAINAILQGLGVNADIKEGWETGGAAYTFSFTAWANANLHPNEPSILNQKLYDNILQAVDSAKPARAHYSFTVGAQFNNTLALTSTASIAQSNRQTAVAKRLPFASLATLKTAATQSLAQIARLGGIIHPVILAQRALRVGNSSSSAQVVRVTMEIV